MCKKLAKVQKVRTTLNIPNFKRGYWNLCDVRRCTKNETWKCFNGFLLHVNALCHKLLLLRKFLASKSLFVCWHLSYSPDLTPCGFWPFQKKIGPKGKNHSCHWEDYDRAVIPKFIPKMFPVMDVRISTVLAKGLFSIFLINSLYFYSDEDYRLQPKKTTENLLNMADSTNKTHLQNTGHQYDTTIDGTKDWFSNRRPGQSHLYKQSRPVECDVR